MIIQRSVFAVTLLSAACAHQPTFTPTQFEHETYKYKVHYAEGGRSGILSKEWRLDNYVLQDGVPTRPKSGSEYKVVRGYDFNDDGETDRKEEESFYDLKLEHRRKDAEIFLRTVPLSNEDAEKELSAFASRYVEAAAGSGEVVIRFGAEGPLGTVGKRFASRVLSQSECTVAGRPAHRVDFEIANVDQLQLSQDARWSRLRLVLVRTPLLKEFPYGPEPGSKITYPVLMIAGLAAAPENFNALAPDLDQFLTLVEIEGTKGNTCTVQRDPPAAVPESVPTATATSGAEVPVEAASPADGSTPPAEPAGAPTP